MLFSNTSSFAQRRAGQVLPDRAQHGCCARAYRDIFTACPGVPAPLGALDQSVNAPWRKKEWTSAFAEVTARGGRWEVAGGGWSGQVGLGGGGDWWGGEARAIVFNTASRVGRCRPNDEGRECAE